MSYPISAKLWALILMFGYSVPTLAFADCVSSLPQYQACESLLMQGSVGFQRLLSEFSKYKKAPTQPSQVTKLQIAPLFFKGASYFGLFQMERSPTLKCEYAERAQDALTAYSQSALAYVQNNPDLQVQGWLMRQSIYSSEIAKLRNCVARGPTDAQIRNWVVLGVSERMSDFLSSPTERSNTFEPVFTKMKSVISITSDILSKIQSFKIELEGIQRQISNEENKKGTTSIRLEEFALNSSITLQPLQSQLRQWNYELNQLPDIESIVSRREEILNRNNTRGRALIENANKAEEYVRQVVSSNLDY
jgi:hypothetical protein